MEIFDLCAGRRRRTPGTSMGNKEQVPAGEFQIMSAARDHDVRRTSS
ncbi:hypothetical protein KCP71_08215 [Salmonella enterica subsp. enterica]|nr:hypothetical protein KCP71_08215 [Salmonella enterica subsp. enterica]